MCASCASNTAVVRIEFCTHSILAAWPFCFGGDKTGDDRWYDKFVPLADRIYDTHIEALEKESKSYG